MILDRVVGDRRERRRAGGRARRRERQVGDRHAVPSRGERRDLPLAVPALAEPHRGAREGLDDVDVRGGVDRPVELRAPDLLAAADDGIRGGQLVDPGADAVHPVERALEAEPLLEPPPHRRGARPRPPASPSTREPPLVLGDVRAADARAVAGREHAGDASSAATRRPRRPARRDPRRSPARTPRPGRARPTGRSRSRCRAHPPRRAPPCPAAHASRRRRPRARPPRRGRAPRHARRSAGSAAAPGRAAARCGSGAASRSSGMFPRAAAARRSDVARPRRRPRLERRDDVDAVVVELGREGERERPAAGEEQPLAGRDPVRLDDRLCRPRRQHAGQRPARETRPAGRARPGRAGRVPAVTFARLLALGRRARPRCRACARQLVCSRSRAPERSAASISARPRT